jgi:hypothetical protein
MRRNKQDHTNEMSRRALLEPLEERRLLASVQGVVFEDFNGNGFKEPEDPGINATRVYLDLDGNGVYSAGEPQTLAGPSGTYTLTGITAGTYTLRAEKPSADWRFVTPVAGAHTLVIASASDALIDRDFGLNAPPRIVGMTNQSVTEGNAMIHLGLIADAADDGPWQVVIAWGDGKPNHTFSTASLGSLGQVNHEYGDNGQYNATITVTDKNNASGSAAFSVTVTNAPPTATLHNGGPVGEGQAVGIWFQNISDPAAADRAAGFKYSYDFNNDGAWDIVDSDQSFASTVYMDNKIQTVTAQIKDKDGGTTSLSTQVVINNVPPALTISGPSLTYAGNVYSLNLSAVDPGDDTTISWDINWGDGTVTTISPAAPQAYRVYSVPGTYFISASATDDDGTYIAPMGVPVTVALMPSTITGTVINDVDGNGKQGAREPSAGKRIIFLDLNRNGVWSADEPRTVTSAAGVYQFNNVEPGFYRVQVALPKKWLPSNPTTGWREIYVGPGTSGVGNNFFVTTRSRATGRVYLDVNRNRRLDGKDKPLNKWRVFIDDNGNGRLNRGELFARTNSAGVFTLNGLTRGIHSLRLHLPKGYSLTAPKKEEYVLKVGVGQTIKARMFGTTKIKAKAK